MSQRATRGLVGCAALWLALLLSSIPFSAHAARCLYVSSYHKGYPWADGIERGIERVLAGKCQLRTFYMDTRRNTSENWAKAKAREAHALIESYRPDVLIVSDDNASKYLVMPYYRDADLPVVFCGINWTVSEYGYPYSNSTGMVEVAPVRPMLRQIRRILPGVRTGLYLSSNVRTEHKDYERYKRVYGGMGVKLDAMFVSTLRAWEAGYIRGQQYDFIILGNYVGIRDWNSDDAERFAIGRAGALTVTNYDWMMPFAAFGITKQPEEQGEWAAKAALAILHGTQPSDIPVVANRRWEVWINPLVLKRINLKLPDSLLFKARRFGR